MHGDVNAYCVFANHCGCGEGFKCENDDVHLGKECNSGTVCVPDGMFQKKKRTLSCVSEFQRASIMF